MQKNVNKSVTKKINKIFLGTQSIQNLRNAL